jgi:hypothetical protein
MYHRLLHYYHGDTIPLMSTSQIEQCFIIVNKLITIKSNELYISRFILLISILYHFITNINDPIKFVNLLYFLMISYMDVLKIMMVHQQIKNIFV